jgi:hypothetical protein
MMPGMGGGGGGFFVVSTSLNNIIMMNNMMAGCGGDGELTESEIRENWAKKAQGEVEQLSSGSKSFRERDNFGKFAEKVTAQELAKHTKNEPEVFTNASDMMRAYSHLQDDQVELSDKAKADLKKDKSSSVTPKIMSASEMMRSYGPRL